MPTCIRRKALRSVSCCITVIAMTVAWACGSPEPAPAPVEEAATEAAPADAAGGLPPTPEGFEPVPEPAENPTTEAKVALGHQLFFDARLSADGSRSCYSCHLNEHGLTDGKPTAEGALGRNLTRSSPSLWNIGYHTEFYWDGRSPSLEKQAMAAWTGGNMGADADEIVTELNQIEGYRTQFQEVFGEDATPDSVVKAISAYERAFLFCADTAYDRWRGGRRERGE